MEALRQRGRQDDRFRRGAFKRPLERVSLLRELYYSKLELEELGGRYPSIKHHICLIVVS